MIPASAGTWASSTVLTSPEAGGEVGALSVGVGRDGTFPELLRSNGVGFRREEWLASSNIVNAGDPGGSGIAAIFGECGGDVVGFIDVLSDRARKGGIESSDRLNLIERAGPGRAAGAFEGGGGLAVLRGALSGRGLYGGIESSVGSNFRGREYSDGVVRGGGDVGDLIDVLSDVAGVGGGGFLGGGMIGGGKSAAVGEE